MISGFNKEYSFLSNFYEAAVVFKGIEYKSVEAAFQAQKCPGRADEFISLTASEAKHLGRRVQLRADWEEVCAFS